ncbi:MAG: aminotransferase class IV [Opitutaceae bacterium]|jgi:branched-chain amino acid aminotransferase
MLVDYIQANTNGRLHPAHEPSLSPLNRGFLYGDAVYEVWRSYHGVLFAWDEHWRRLERSATALNMPVAFTQERIFSEILRTAEAYLKTTGKQDIDLYVRLQLTQGSDTIGLDSALADKPEFVLLVQPNPHLSVEKLRDGLKLSLAMQLRRNPAASLNPAWKTGNYLNNILCLREARDRGADEVAITNLNGDIAEAAVCNLGFFRDDTFVTPPLDAGILGGITRGLVLGQIAQEAGFKPVEEVVRPGELDRFQECCLLSTTKDIAPVSAIDAIRFHIAPDSRVMRLKTTFASYTRAYASARPELRIT